MQQLIEQFKQSQEMRLFRLIYERHMTQESAGELLGISQSKASKLLKRLKNRVPNFDMIFTDRKPKTFHLRASDDPKIVEIF